MPDWNTQKLDTINLFDIQINWIIWSTELKTDFDQLDVGRGQIKQNNHLPNAYKTKGPLGWHKSSILKRSFHRSSGRKSLCPIAKLKVCNYEIQF